MYNDNYNDKYNNNNNNNNKFDLTLFNVKSED